MRTLSTEMAQVAGVPGPERPVERVADRKRDAISGAP